MKGLATLIKLQKNRVDEQQQVLAKLQNHLDSLEAQLKKLLIERQQERAAFNQDNNFGLTFGAFMKASLAKEKELEKNCESARQAVEIARERLSQLFEEQKRYEIAQKNRETEEMRIENRRETAALDEIGSINFTRKQKE